MTVRRILKNTAGLLLIVGSLFFSAKSVFAESNFHILCGAADLSGENCEGTEEEESTPVISFDVEPTEKTAVSGTVSNGILIGGVDVSGMTYDEARTAIQSYIATLRTIQITLVSVNDNQAVVTAGDLGISWTNEDVIEEAVLYGKSGNPVVRYKEQKDLEQEKKVYALDLQFDRTAIRSAVEAQGEQYNVEAIEASMTKEDDGFQIVSGQIGYIVNEDASVNLIAEALTSWDGQPAEIRLQVDVAEPKGTAEELSLVKDVLGTYTTSFSSSATERSGNVRNGTKLINGTLLYPGDTFSAYETVSPFTEENGYYLAGSYLNGMVVESLGGGICQVSSTLYNAVIRAELQVDERYNHSMIVGYVQLSADAAISGTYKDFKFTNSSEYPIYIEGYTTDDKKITFTIYGVETRPANRTIEFESVELSKTEPEGEKVIEDSAQPAGYISVQSAHIGYVGELWKVVKIDGTETERTQLNKSTYTASPKTATVGTAASDPSITTMLQAAIATGSIDYCKSIISQLNAAAADAVAAGAAQ